MKAPQATSLLLCLLLSSTLAHDYLRARHLSPSASRHLAETSSKQISPFHERASSSLSGQQCVYICNSTTTSNSSTSNLQLIINSTTELIGVVNITANVAIIFDISSGLFGLFNGTSGAVVVWNITSQSGIYIAPGQTERGWLNSTITFESYFKSLTSLSFFFSLGVGTRFTAKNIRDDVLRIIGYLLGSLSASIALQIQQNIKGSLTLFIQIGNTIHNLCRGELKLILTFAEDGLIRLQGDILWFVNVFQGLASFFSQVSGGLAYLIKIGVQFRLALLFSAANGIEVFVNLLLAIIARVDIGKVLKNTLNSFEGLISLLIQLGGSASGGVTGVLKIVGGILQLRNGSVKIEVVFGYIFEYIAARNASGDGEIDISIYFSGLLDVISVQNSTHSNTKSLTEFTKIVGQLIGGTLVVNGVNVSKIITSLTASIESGITLVINILNLMSSFVTLYVSIPALFFYIIQQLNTAEGTLLVQAVFADIHFNVSTSGNGRGCLKGILHRLTFSNFLRLIFGGINKLLKNLPIIGDIYVEISTALKKVTDGKFDLTQILSSKGGKAVGDAIIKFLKQIFQGNQSATTTKSPISNHWTWSWAVSYG